MTQVRSAIRGQVRSAVRGPMTLARGSGQSVHDGISYNAATGRVVLKAVGASPTITTLTSAFTFTCGNQSMFMGPAGLLVPAVTNVPRIEYDANGNCLGLLMEASRTNLALQSQDLATSHALAALLAFGSGSIANATAAPDGTVTADKIVEDTATTTHRIRQATDVTIASGNVVSFSFFVKAAERTRCRLRITESTFASAYEVSFNLGTGTIGTATTTGVASGGTSRIQALPNGWYRVAISAALNGGFLAARCLLELEDASGNNGYTGDGVSGLFAWGEQIEVGAFASSYIPTTTTSIARTACSAIRTLGSEFSATAGTVVVAGRASGGQDPANGNHFWEFDNLTAAERIRFFRALGSDTARTQYTAASATQALLDATFVNLTAFKAATAWAANDFASSFNGAAVLTDAAGTVPTATALGLGVSPVGADNCNGHILRFDYWPSRLPNNMLQQLST